MASRASRGSVPGSCRARVETSASAGEPCAGREAEGGERRQDTGGGEEVSWSPDGHNLFYREGLKWMSVDVQTQPEFHAEAPKFMFEGPYLNVPGVSYDVAPDGRFIMLEESVKQPPTTHLNVVLNWLEELRRLPATNK